MPPSRSRGAAGAAAAASREGHRAAFERRKPARRPLPEHLPRERIVYPSPSACPCCGGVLHKLGEDVTETLELIPRQWKVIQHVREKFSCRSCEAITQPPAPSHPIARGRAGPGLLAHILFAKYGLHLPLNRQSAVYAREGIDLDVSTLADWVGAAAATLMPLVDAIRSHVFAAERIHADDTTVPVLAKGKTRTGRLWTYVRDDRPFGGRDPPAAVFFYSPDRGGEHPEQHLAGYAGLMQADAYAGFNRLYEARRKPGRSSRRRAGPMRGASSSTSRGSTRRRSPSRRSSASMRCSPSSARSTALRPHSACGARRAQPAARRRTGDLAARATRQALRPSQDRQGIAYSLTRWVALTRFLDDGRLCMSNNAAEREIRPIAVGRKNWTFAGSDEGGRRAAAIYTLIQTAKLNDVDPQAWLADVLARLQDHPAKRIAELLPWNRRLAIGIMASAGSLLFSALNLIGAAISAHDMAFAKGVSGALLPLSTAACFGLIGFVYAELAAHPFVRRRDGGFFSRKNLLEQAFPMVAVLGLGYLLFGGWRLIGAAMV